MIEPLIWPQWLLQSLRSLMVVFFNFKKYRQQNLYLRNYKLRPLLSSTSICISYSLQSIFVQCQSNSSVLFYTVVESAYRLNRSYPYLQVSLLTSESGGWAILGTVPCAFLIEKTGITERYNVFSQYNQHQKYRNDLQNQMDIRGTNGIIQEDLELKSVVNSQTKKNWVQISKVLNSKFSGKDWTSKQCRERFINHCSLEMSPQATKDWTQEQIKKLLDLFEIWGPRWTIIAPNLPGRTQNSIKNKFYSGLRRFVRKLNVITKRFFKKYKKELKYTSVLRVLEASRSLFFNNETLIKISQERRHEIISLMNSNFQNVSDQEVVLLVQKINQFNLQTRSFRCRKIYPTMKQAQSSSIVEEIDFPSKNSEMEMKKVETRDRIDEQRVDKDQKSSELKQNGKEFSQKGSELDKDGLIDYLQLFFESKQCSNALPCLTQLQMLESPLRMQDLY